MTKEIIMLVVAGLFAIGALILVFFAVTNDSFILGILTVVAFALSLAFVMMAGELHIENEIISGNYTVYIDGVEVDRTKIDIKQYKITFNEETHEVYCTAK